MTEVTTDVWGDSVFRLFICPPADKLAAAGMTEDTWWSALQDADDTYVRMALAVDWQKAAKVARTHSLRDNGSRSFSSTRAAYDLQAAQADLFDPATYPLDDDSPYLPYLPWDRIVMMAEGHWLRRFGNTADEIDHGNDIDAEALREAFLSVDEGEMYGCAQVAPRHRNMRETLEPASRAALQFHQRPEEN